MAKATETAAAAEEPRITMEDLYASFSQEEMAEFFDSTGQAANVRERIPILKINYCDLADKTGREVKKGNFVINQDTTEVEVEVEEDGQTVKEKRVEDLGVDLGKSVAITILTYGFRYSYFPKDKDKKKICSSQLVFDRNREKAVGSKLQRECGKECPMRAEGRDRQDKCGCQWVLFVRVPLPDGTKLDALFYVKGTSYMPFSDYIKSLGTVPVFFAPTKIGTTMEREGTVNYWVCNFTFQKDKAFPAIEIRENGAAAKKHREAAEAYKAQQALANKNGGGVQAQIASKTEGTNAQLIKDDEVGEIAFD